mgnify:CR=1 FL=1
MELDESMSQVLIEHKCSFIRDDWPVSLSLLFSGSHLLKFEWILLLFWRFKSVASEVWSYVTSLYIQKKLDFIQVSTRITLPHLYILCDNITATDFLTCFPTYQQTSSLFMISMPTSLHGALLGLVRNVNFFNNCL